MPEESVDSWRYPFLSIRHYLRAPQACQGFDELVQVHGPAEIHIVDNKEGIEKLEQKHFIEILIDTEGDLEAYHVEMYGWIATIL